MGKMSSTIEWYSSISSQKDIPTRCPYANVDRCPVYYLSLSLFGSFGIMTALAAPEEKRLLNKWEKSEHWPKINEHSPSILGPSDSRSFSHFCPEVAYDVFGLFASELHRYAGGLDIDVAHKQLGRQGAPATDWRWQWSQITPLHYSECHLYSQLISKNEITNDKIKKEPIIEAKPGAFGFSVNMKELVKRLYTWIFSHSVN